MLVNIKKLSELCEQIEEELAKVETLEELKEARKAYFKEHRYIVSYLLFLQEDIEHDKAVDAIL